MGDRVGGERARRADTTQIHGMIPAHRAFARLALAEGDREPLGEIGQCLSGLRIAYPAAADDDRLAAAGDQLRGPLGGIVFKLATADAMHPLGEEMHRIVVSLALHVLG